MDWEKIKETTQLKIQKNKIKENLKLVLHHYNKGDLITMWKPGVILHTLALPWEGLYKVLKHYVNGLITTE